jgi:hypothetical protein
MTQKIINTGIADKGNGDPIRTAFTKVNDNFAELYSQLAASVVVGATAPTGPEEGSLWWNSADGRMYVYYGSAWVDASPVDGAGISSTNQLVNGGNTVSLGTDGKLTLPNGVKITPIAFDGIDLEIGTKIWNFGADGKLTLPTPAPITFTANLVPVYHAGGGGDAWYYTVIFQPNVNGDVETMISGGDRVWDHNPGYQSGDSWNFTQADHGIPGYTFTFILASVDNIGEGQWTAQFAVSQGPEYPSTVKSPATIKLSADTKNWQFGTDGSLTIPEDGEIKGGPNGFNSIDLSWELILNSGKTIKINPGASGVVSPTLFRFDSDVTGGGITLPAGSTLEDRVSGVLITGAGQEAVNRFYEKLSDTLYETVDTDTGVTYRLINQSGTWSLDEVGADNPRYTSADLLTWTGGISPAPTGELSTRATELSVGNNNTWRFGGDGSITFPNSTTIADATETITYNAINSLNYESGKIGTFATLNLDATDPKSVGGGWIVNGPGVTDGVVDGTDTLVQTVSISTSTGNAFIDGESYTFTSPTLFSIGSKITVTNNDWTFSEDGSLTLPGTVVNSTVAKDGPTLPTTTGVLSSLNHNFTFSGLTDGTYGPFTLGVVTFRILVGGGTISSFVNASATGNVTVNDVLGTIDSGDLGGAPGLHTITITVQDVVQATPVALDLTKTVNKLADGAYSLADGVEGQIMYLVKQTGNNGETTIVYVANSRANGTTFTDLGHRPFRFGAINVDIDMLIFTDGAWQASPGDWGP